MSMYLRRVYALSFKSWQIIAICLIVEMLNIIPHSVAHIKRIRQFYKLLNVHSIDLWIFGSFFIFLYRVRYYFIFDIPIKFRIRVDQMNPLFDNI